MTKSARKAGSDLNLSKESAHVYRTSLRVMCMGMGMFIVCQVLSVVPPFNAVEQVTIMRKAWIYKCNFEQGRVEQDGWSQPGLLGLVDEDVNKSQSEATKFSVEGESR